MDEEKVLNLFDFYWFYHKSFENPPSSPHPNHPIPITAKTQIEIPLISPLRRLLRRSLSDQLTSKLDPLSPNSVLSTSKLETIHSEKESGEIPAQEEVDRPSKKALRGRKKKGSRSLSELEFEELKGFLDLGFTFSEVENDSRLVSIVPGLQRIGKRGGGEEEESVVVSRPYLSEAWGSDRKKEDPLMNWRISAVGDEIDMKDQLRFWAHAVASTVR